MQRGRSIYFLPTNRAAQEKALLSSLKRAISDFFITFSYKLLIWCLKGYFLYDK